MEISFIWIEKYKNIRNVGFNIDPFYKFRYDINKNFLFGTKNKNIKYKISKEPFMNITALVGMNGAGKSAFFDFIKNVLCQNESYEDKAIIIFKKDGAKKNEFNVMYMNYDNSLYPTEKTNYMNLLEVKCNEKGKIAFVSKKYYNRRKCQKNNDVPILLKTGQFDTTEFAFYSNIFDYKAETESNFMRNLSTNYFVINSGQSAKYRVEEIRRQIDFYFSAIFRNYIGNDNISNSFVKTFGMDIPNELTISFSNYRKEYFIEAFGYKKAKKKCFSDFYEEIKGLKRVCLEKEKENTQYINVISRISSQLILRLLNSYTMVLTQDEVDQLFTVLNECITDKDKSNSVIEDKFQKKMDNINIIKKFIIKNSVSELSFSIIINLIINYLNKFHSEERSNNEYIEQFRVLKTLCLELSSVNNYVECKRASITFELKKNKDTIKKIFNVINELDVAENYFEYEWRDMSSGEKSLFSLFSRLYILSNFSNASIYSTNKYYKKYREESPLKNIILLIDEGEAYLHPEWKRKYVKFLIDNIPIVLPNIKLQLIISTHSPLLLSDFPRSNVIFVEKTEKGLSNVLNSDNRTETFAANISKLYANSFFLKENLIGEYAINAFERELSTFQTMKNINKRQYNKYKNFINVIGEPLIRESLLKELEKKKRVSK